MSRAEGDAYFHIHNEKQPGLWVGSIVLDVMALCLDWPDTPI